MRLKEVLTESEYIENAKELIKTLLITLKANNIQEVNTKQIVNELEKNGYSLDEKFVEEFLSNVSFVSSIKNNKIFLNTEIDTGDYETPDEEDLEDKKAFRNAINAINSNKKLEI